MVCMSETEEFNPDPWESRGSNEKEEKVVVDLQELMGGHVLLPPLLSQQRADHGRDAGCSGSGPMWHKWAPIGSNHKLVGFSETWSIWRASTGVCTLTNNPDSKLLTEVFISPLFLYLWAVQSLLLWPEPEHHRDMVQTGRHPGAGHGGWVPHPSSSQRDERRLVTPIRCPFKQTPKTWRIWLWCTYWTY